MLISSLLSLLSVIWDIHYLVCVDTHLPGNSGMVQDTVVQVNAINLLPQGSNVITLARRSYSKLACSCFPNAYQRPGALNSAKFTGGLQKAIQDSTKGGCNNFLLFTL